MGVPSHGSPASAVLNCNTQPQRRLLRIREHRNGRIMDSQVWEPWSVHPWESNYYVVCICGVRTDHEDPWELMVVHAAHIV